MQPSTNIKLIKEVIELSPDVQEKLLEVAIMAMDEQSHSTSYALLESVTSACDVSTDIVGEFIYMLKTFLFIEKSEFCKKMFALGYPEKYIKSCISKLTHVQKSMSGSYKLTSFKWRIDISFLNSKSLKKVPAPVIISLKMSDGRKYIIEMNVKMFNKLRLGVATLVKTLEELKD